MERFSRMKRATIGLLTLVTTVFVFGACGGRLGELPIEKLKQNLQDVPTYSIILDDMKEEGNFSNRYYHKYRVVFPEASESTPTEWLEVREDYYKTNASFLGMTLVVKKDGQLSSSVSPPGYQYVGDAKYGQWRNDSHGNSFWEFYGKYALFSSLFGGHRGPIYRNDYDGYRQYRSRNAPYYGKNNQYGTSGSFTKQSKPNFYSRRTARQKTKSASFKSRVAKRTGRTRTGYRGRSGGFGK